MLVRFWLFYVQIRLALDVIFHCRSKPQPFAYPGKTGYALCLRKKNREVVRAAYGGDGSPHIPLLPFQERSMPYIRLDDLDQIELIPGFKGRFVHAENMTVANWRIDEGSVAPEHAHPHEQITFVVEGNFELTLEGETRVLDAGLVAVIPPNVPHRGRALTNCRLKDIFYPVREDLR
jgi:mannose-6-phosphate isomerase-like protein (cupin superfamily)